MIPIVSNLEDIISDANQRQVDYLKDRNEKLEQQNAEMLAMLKMADELIRHLIKANAASKEIYDKYEELSKFIKKVEGEQ